MGSRPAVGLPATSRVAIAVLTIAIFPASGARASERRLQGDPQAVTLIERMLEQFGGIDTWAAARTLHLEYRVWRTEPDEQLSERAWRDLQEPNQRIDLVSPSAPLTWVFGPASGWVARQTGVAVLSEKRRAEAVADWPFDFYTLIRAFAVADQRLRLRFVAPRRVLVSTATGDDWGWWEIDSSGALIKWGVTFGDGPVEYVYGPIRKFDNIAFPAWGANVDGSWRFEYTKVELSTQPIPAALLAQPR